MPTPTKTGPQVVESFVEKLVMDATADLQLAQERRDSAASDEETNKAEEAVAQATARLQVAQAIKDLADNGQLTEKRLQTKLKALRSG